MNFTILGIPVHICPQEILAFFYSITCLACIVRVVSGFIKSKLKPKPHKHEGCQGHAADENVAGD